MSETMTAAQQNRHNLRTVTRGLYDQQKLRIMMGNRIVANFKAKLGQEPSKPEEDISDEGKELLAAIRAEYDRITDGVAKLPRKSPNYVGMDLIGSDTELLLVHSYFGMVDAENEVTRRLAKILKDFPVFTQFLSLTRGCGPLMSAVLISELDPVRARHPSSFWKYAGLDVAEDGAGRSRRKEHQVDVEFINKDGNKDTKKGITFNPWLKTKLFVLGTSFIRSGGHYREIYDGYKHRLETDPRHEEKSKGHRHNMALRYMLKMFLVDLHMVWRKIEGLPVSVPYHEAKQGHKHGGEEAA